MPVARRPTTFHTSRIVGGGHREEQGERLRRARRCQVGCAVGMDNPRVATQPGGMVYAAHIRPVARQPVPAIDHDRLAPNIDPPRQHRPVRPEDLRGDMRCQVGGGDRAPERLAYAPGRAGIHGRQPFHDVHESGRIELGSPEPRRQEQSEHPGIMQSIEQRWNEPAAFFRSIGPRRDVIGLGQPVDGGPDLDAGAMVGELDDLDPVVEGIHEDGLYRLAFTAGQSANAIGVRNFDPVGTQMTDGGVDVGDP